MKLMHIADLHLRDSQFGRPDRGADFTNAVLTCVDEAASQGIKYILAAGDLLNSKKPSSANVADLVTINDKLESHGITMVAIPGDHDACELSWINALKRTKGLSRILDITDTTYSIPVEGSDAVITVYGAPKAKMHPAEFRQVAGEWPAATILLYHGPFKEFAGFKMPDDALGIADLPTDRYEVIALGDLHACKYVEYMGCLIGYPGPTEYCSANEIPQKSVTILRFDAEGHVLKFNAKTDIVPIRTRKVVQKEVRNEDDMSALMQELLPIASLNPIVHVWHDACVPSVFERLSQVIDPRKGIVRVQNKGDMSGAPANIHFGSLDTPEEGHQKRVVDFVSEFASEGDPIYDLMVTLCDTEEQPGHLMDKYVSSRLTHLTNVEKTF